MRRRAMARGPRPWHRFAASTLVALLALEGCAVGPDYHGPPDAAPLSRAAGAFRRADPTDAGPLAPQPARWWEPLHDAELNHLIELAFAQSPTLRVAQARILEARATLAKQRAAGYPSATATAAAIKANVPAGSPLAAFGASSGDSSASASGSGTSGTSNGGSSSADSGGNGSGSAQPASGRQTFDFYTAGFDAIWELDLFGGIRRGVEGARASAEAAAARYEDAQVQLAAEVGQAYAGLRGVQAQLALARRNLEIQQKLLELTQARRQYGTADDLDVERARAQRTRARADLVPLQGQLEQAQDQLALLTGQEPGTLDGELASPKPLPALPASVPVGDPASMLRRRPDIRAAERGLASSNAAIGQAVAQYFPRVRLIGNIGYSAGKASELFDRNKLAALGGPLLQWNFLNFGSTRAQVRQARAANDEAIARYDGAVLAALQDAEGSLSRFRHQRENAVELTDARDAAARAAVLARTRYGGGTASLMDALDADRQRLQAEQSLLQSQAELVRDYVALQKSLGLGWQPAPDEGDAASSRRPSSLPACCALAAP
jgi:NodT family efflux transporter outer membrane factor (OMF) lipoprotein